LQRSHIVEGYSRKASKELQRFINISLGSLAETKYLIHFSHRLGLLKKEDFKTLFEGYETLGKLLWKFYEAIKND